MLAPLWSAQEQELRAEARRVSHGPSAFVGLGVQLVTFDVAAAQDLINAIKLAMRCTSAHATARLRDVVTMHLTHALNKAYLTKELEKPVHELLKSARVKVRSSCSQNAVHLLSIFATNKKACLTSVCVMLSLRDVH